MKKVLREIATSYFDKVSRLIDSINIDDIETAVQIILEAQLRQSTIFVAGNGGSAATVAHWANDIASTTKKYNKNNPARVFSLVDNTAWITAIANDFCYSEIFSQQLSNQASENDVLIVVSASGNSQNLLSAVDFAKKNNEPIRMAHGRGKNVMLY